jgi:hypothetical protein
MTKSSIVPTPAAFGIFLAAAPTELERAHRWAAELATLPQVHVSPGWLDDASWRALAAAQPPARSIFAAIRRSRVVWVLLPSGRCNERAAGALAYGIAHRWHVGPRLQVIASGVAVLDSSLAQAADAWLVDDAAAFELCAQRVRPLGQPRMGAIRRS